MSVRARRSHNLVLRVATAGLLIALAGCGSGGPEPPGSSGSLRPTVSSTPSASPPETPSSGPTAPSSPPTPAVTQQRPGWALDRIDQRKRPLDQRFTTIGQGAGVTIYVVDGLFDVKHPDFGGRAFVGLKLGERCVLEDGTNHGLFVAGLAGGRRTGVAKQAKIVLVGSSNGCEGAETDDTEAQQVERIARSITWVADNARPPAVVNLSLNVDAPAPGFSAAVERLVQAGLTVVASAGNDGEDACRHPPAGLPDVITVAAMSQDDEDAELNYGRCVDLYAPAVGVTSLIDPKLIPDGLGTSDFAATSWAAPLASGAAALYLSAHPEATPAQVRTWLIENATTGAVGGNRHGSPNRLLFTGGPR